MNKIFSFEGDLSEREFLKRELNLDLIKIKLENIDSLLQLESYALATSKINEVKDLISKSKDNSVILFFFGNETYDVSEFNSLNQWSRKIKKAYFQMLPKKTKWSVYFKIIPSTLHDGALYFNKDSNFFRQLKNGFDLLKRTRYIKIQFDVENFPQGYSNRFVKELRVKYPYINEGSIISFENPKMEDRSILIGFCGQMSNWNRNFALQVLHKHCKNSSIIITSGWAGAQQGEKIDYLDVALNSKFIWNPPGNITNRTHRYLESLICGAIPLLPPSTLQDPHLWDIWTENLGSKFYSWKFLIQFANRSQDAELTEICKKELARQSNLIEKLKYDIERLVT